MLDNRLRCFDCSCTLEAGDIVPWQHEMCLLLERDGVYFDYEDHDDNENNIGKINAWTLLKCEDCLGGIEDSE